MTQRNEDLSDLGKLELTKLDPAALHPLSGIYDNKEVDYLMLEDEAIATPLGAKSVLPSRNWRDELCYGTGTTYLAGLGLGGLWGFREGWLRRINAPNLAAAASQVGAGAAAAAAEGAPAGAPTATEAHIQQARMQRRLRWNAVLNGVTRRGSMAGNTAGVVAMIYNLANSSFDSYRGYHDIWGSMAAGATTGALWRCTAGPRAMLVSSTVLSLGAAGWTILKPIFL